MNYDDTGRRESVASQNMIESEVSPTTSLKKWLAIMNGMTTTSASLPLPLILIGKTIIEN